MLNFLRASRQGCSVISFSNCHSQTNIRRERLERISWFAKMLQPANPDCSVRSPSGQ